MKNLLLCSCFILSTLSVEAYERPSGYVPNEETAIAIAVAVWNPIYGKDVIAKEKPYSANLVDVSIPL